MSMTDLQNQTILITRPPHKAQGMADLIRKQNGRPVLFPTIRIGPPDHWEPVDQAIHNLARYDWVIFTSTNGVRFFTRRVRDIADLSVFSPVKVAAVGSKTADTLKDAGIAVDVIPKEYTAAKLLDTLIDQHLRRQSFLLVLGDKARKTLSDGLIAAGAQVDQVTVYSNTRESPENLEQTIQQLRQGHLRVLTFTSPSTFHNFLDILSEVEEEVESLLRRQTFAAIGPVTAQTIREKGFLVEIVPEESTIEGMLEAIAGYLESHTTHSRTEVNDPEL